HVDDPVRASFYSSFLERDSARYDELSPVEQRLARMLYYSLWSDGGGYESVAEGFDAVRREVATRAEISTVVNLSFQAARHVPIPLDESLSGVPLQIHARYQREEILAALDFPRLPNS